MSPPSESSLFVDLQSKLSSLSLSSILAACSVIYVSYLISLVYIRLYASPLAKYPGPKLSALTLWYEFYYEVILRGKFAWEIKRMHEVYGPIVRINPYELHISDPEFYDELYTGPKRPRNKYAWSAAMFGNSGSMLSTVPHDHHRLRRGAINPYFSTASVTRLEPIIKSKIEELCDRLASFKGKDSEATKPEDNGAINIHCAYTALTTEIISQFSWGASYGFLAKDDFSADWVELWDAVSEGSLLHKQIPQVLNTMQMMPEWVLRASKSNFLQLIKVQKLLQSQVKDIMERHKAGDALSTISADDDGTAAPTMFHQLLSSSLPPAELSLPRLVDEAQTLIAAGSITTAWYLKVLTYHLLANPDILAKLRAELEEVAQTLGWEDPWAEMPTVAKFEQCKYLQMVVNEGFRISYGVTARLTRIAPTETLFYTDKHSGKKWAIPPGTPVGMSSIIQHRDPNLWPDPERFDPERWRATVEGNEHLDRYLTTFNKGTRVCMGKNLARTEIFLCVPAIVRRFMYEGDGWEGKGRGKMELYKTDRSDVEVVHDFFNPSARLDSKGLRVVIR